MVEWKKSAYGTINALHKGVIITITPNAFASGHYRVRVNNGIGFGKQFFKTLREAKNAGIAYAEAQPMKGLSGKGD